MVENSQDSQETGVTIIPTGCCHDCGGRCVLKAHIKDGKIIRFETDDGEEPQIRACARGRAYRQRLYSPDRLTQPLRRVGERGEGKFEAVSWDVALEKVAAELLRVRDTYGHSAILFAPGAGNQGMLHGPGPVGRVLLNLGGFTRPWSSPSYEAALFASMATYGTIRTGNSREDLLNTKLILMWAWDPVRNIQDPGTALYLAQAHEKGIKTVAIDPRYTDTAANFADRWIPIRPGTDIAMLIAMAYVIVTENLHDQAFIDKYTVGFDKYCDYLLGREDGTAKTPQWAENITKVPATTIADLAREYATTKPAALIAGWGPARAAQGEQYSRAANVLTAITGNIGIPGGFAAGFMRAYSSRETRRTSGGKRLINVVEEGAPPRKDSLYKLRGGTNPNSNRIHYNELYDAILKGRDGGYPADIKLAYIVAGNILNQHGNTNRGIEAFKSSSLEFIVVHEQFMTPTARFADIILPVNTFMERSEIAPPWLGSPYYIYLNKAVDSLYDTKTDLDICRELAVKLGIPEIFGDTTEDDMLRAIASTRDDIQDYDIMKHDGVRKIKLDEPVISFKEQIQDPENNPFPTLSGKIEIYCEHLAEMNDPMIPPIPKYISPRENYDDPLADNYPLQLITPHPKRGTHSSLDMVPWLREIEEQALWINPVDAEERGIRDSDKILVFNDRGKVLIPARVTRRIMPGVVCLYEGSWYKPDENGIDHGGCANVLTLDDRSPGGATTVNTNLVEVSLAT